MLQRPPGRYIQTLALAAALALATSTPLTEGGRKTQRALYIQNFIKEHHIVPAVGDGLSVVLMASVGEVHPGNVHSRVDHFEEEFWGSGHRTDSADDSGQSNVGGPAENSKG